MANYIESPDPVIQNLEDAGCDPETVAQFIGLSMEGNRQNQLKLLKQYRERLLKKVHKNEKRVDYLDYLVFQMNKEERGKQQECRKMRQEECYKNMEKMLKIKDRENMKDINQRSLTGERALLQGKDLKIYDTIFVDGESPSKESSNIEFYRGMSKWKYPLWYSRDVKLEDYAVFEMGWAGIWYTENISMKNCIVEAPKNFRRTNGIELERVTMPNAAEILWNCNQTRMNRVSARGDYSAMNSSNLYIDGFELVGNYFFGGVKYGEIHHARLLFKNAFWNSENITVYGSFISDGYLGWNTKNLTFINCTIKGNQGMRYTDNLVMKNCRLLNTAPAFKYPTMDVEVTNTINSVLNSKSGIIRAEKVEELIMDASEVDVTETLIQPRELKEAAQGALQF